LLAEIEMFANEITDDKLRDTVGNFAVRLHPANRVEGSHVENVFT